MNTTKYLKLPFYGFLGIDRKRIRTWTEQECQLVEAPSKRVRRNIGAGRPAAFPQLEKVLYAWFVDKRNNKIIINYASIREKANELKREMGISEESLRCSDKWIFNFCKRHGLSSRRVTHHGQADNRHPRVLKSIVYNYIQSLNHMTHGLDADHIFNMDETPCYTDMVGQQTIHFQGSRNVDGTHTGHEKSRFTVALCASLSGRMIKSYIIFKNLKKVPNCQVPDNIVVSVSKGGSMNGTLMLDWLDRVFKSRGPYFQTEKCLLLLDSHLSHKDEQVVAACRRMNTEIKLIPAKTTSFLQPLDVGINSPFKAAMRREWSHWYEHGEKEYTAKGYRKRPSYTQLLNFVSNSIKEINRETVQRSFKVCGVAANGDGVEPKHLNSRLRAALDLDQGLVEDGGEDSPFELDSSSDDGADSEDSNGSDMHGASQ